MNVVVISNSYPNKHKSYAGKHVERHVALHREAGLSVRVLSPRESRQGAFWTTWKYLGLGLQVLWAALFTSFDVVHAHWVLPSGLYGAVLSMVRRKPLVVTSHGAFTNTFEDKNLLVRSFVRWVLSRADEVIAVGEEQRQKVAAIAQIPADYVHCINMGILILDTIPSQAEARRRLKLSDDSILIIFVGNLLPRKGPDLLVKAIAELADTYSPRVVIGGQGAHSKQIAQLILDLGLGEQIEMIGSVRPQEVFTWLSAADICVVPSRTEPFGLVAAEALACGTPVVATAVGGLKESVVHERNGLLFPLGDYHGLAACLERLLADPDLRACLAAGARESVLQYDMRLQTARVQDVYAAALSAP
jgi:D-inositol-3-phosphate glycosyltransferase